MKTALIGADGQLGSDLVKVIPSADLTPLFHKDIDITDRSQTFAVLKLHQPNIVINTAAYHRVDDCEDNEELAFKVNGVGVKNLALACQEIDAVLVHMSTDYVFDGSQKTPYFEDDCPAPLNVYGNSKLAGEFFIKSILSMYFIVRSSGLFGVAGCKATKRLNFIEFIVKRAQEQGWVKVVTDQVLSPTYTVDLAKKIYQLIQTNHYGLYHITNSGQCSWFEFTKEIFRIAAVNVDLKPTTSKELKTKAKRPAYSVLKNSNLEQIGLADMRSWQEALQDYFEEKKVLCK